MRILTDAECEAIAGGYTEPTSLGGAQAPTPEPQLGALEGGERTWPIYRIPMLPPDPTVFAER